MAEVQATLVKLVHINRVAKVVKGGRRFRFAAIVIAGNENGMVGIGTGKATEVLEANEKAKGEAIKKMMKVHLKEGRTLHHDVTAKFGAGKVVMRSAPAGTGIIAGGPIRAVCEAAGIKDIVVKSIGSSNPYNMIRAALAALAKVKSPKRIAEIRRIKVSDVVNRRESIIVPSEA